MGKKFKKVVIQYPPLTLRTWRQPRKDRPHVATPKKRKPITRKPIYPKMHKVPASTLIKIWHEYRIFAKNSAILFGKYSQNDGRFSNKVRGKQGPAIAFVAIGYTKMLDVGKWTSKTICSIIQIGTKLYEQSIGFNKNTCDCTAPKEVLSEYFIDETKFVMLVDDNTLSGTVIKTFDEPSLKSQLRNVFPKTEFCILEVDAKFMAIWKDQGSIYMFDAYDRDETSQRVDPGHGVASVLKFIGLARFVKFLQEMYAPNQERKYFTIHLMYIKKFYKEALAPPKDLADIVPPIVKSVSTKVSKSCIASKAPSKAAIAAASGADDKIGPIPEPPGPRSKSKRHSKEKHAKEASSSHFLQDAENTPSYGDLVYPERLGEKTHLFPIEKPKAPPVTYYTWVVPNKMAILIGNCHQNSDKCTKFEGKQALGNAIAALGMRCQYKSKYWYPKLVDEMLLTGETIYIQSRQNFIGDQELTLQNVAQTFSINKRVFKHDIQEVTLIGQLGSEKLNIMDLVYALKEFFSEHDAGIIRGPLLIGVWCEEGKYYMFDPNERDTKGRKIEVDPEINPYPPPGFACVTWFSTVEDLCRLYMKNLAVETRKDHFYISKIQIMDYVEPSPTWNNYVALTTGKWILRGLFSQNNTCFSQASRNTQCTAIATIAVALSKVVDCSTWDRSMIDEIVMDGDKFHNQAVEHLKKNNLFKDKRLMLCEVPLKFVYKNKQLNLIIEDCFINGGVNMKEDVDGVPDLQKGCEQFFKEYSSGVLTCRGISVAIWKADCYYYYFDSHSRDDRGFVYDGGLACCLRFETLSDMVNVILYNLKPQGVDYYNLGRVDTIIWEKTAEGTVKPDFYNYLELTSKKGIIRATTHQGDSYIFDTRAEKQTVPNLLAGLGMTSVLPSCKWDTVVMDQILDLGDKLYEDSRLQIIKKDLEAAEKWETEEPVNMDLIDNNNVIKELKIGANKITFEIKEAQEGIFEPESVKRDKNGNVIYQDYELQNMLWNALEDKTDPKGSKHEMIIESEHIHVAVWKDDDLYYVFDPKGKDCEGNFFGRDMWSAKIVMFEEDYNMDGDAGYPGMTSTISQIMKHSENPETRKIYEEYGEIDEEDNEEDYEDEFFSMKLDITDAKACTIMFTTFDDLYQHIMENVRPNKRVDKFKLYPIEMKSVAVIKILTSPMNKSLGNWFNFEEIEKNNWILRGTMDMTSNTFPEENRGRQYGPMCVAACVYCRLYALIKFKPTTIDYILKYGDKLYTALKQKRADELLKEGLPATEISRVVATFEIPPGDIMHQFLIGDYQVRLEMKANYADGDITIIELPPPPSEEPANPLDEFIYPSSEEEVRRKSKPSRSRASMSRASKSRASRASKAAEDAAASDVVPEKRVDPPKVSLKKGLDKFFRRNSFGVMSVKGKCIALFVIKDVWYLFAPDSRGPKGNFEINGTACIMRFKDMDKFIQHVQDNYLSMAGSNYFNMDGFRIMTKAAKRPAASIPAILPINPNMTAFHSIHPDKHILRGTFHQNNPKFNLPEDATSSCNAIVALAMAQLHPSDTWTKPIVDDVLMNACRLYRQSVDSRGYDFNEWEDRMVLDTINNEFKIGVMTVKWCVIKEGFKRGILTIKSPDIPSLRKTLDNFFIEYTIGIIECDPLTVAFWVHNNLFYMFDPNNRGASGHLSSGGTACLLLFKRMKDLVDHYLANVPPRLHNEEYTVSPIEISTFESKPKKPAPPLKKADILKVKEIDSLSGYVDDGEKSKKGKDKIKKTEITCDKPKKSPKKGKNSSKKDKSTKDPCCCTDKARVIPHDKFVLDDSKYSPEEKKKWAREKSQAKKLKEIQAKERRLRAFFYVLSNGDAIVRAHYSQSSDKFNALSRNKQTHANALVAIVMFKLHEPKTWSYKNIEIVLESGDVLYKDSFIKYRPKNPLLGLRNLLRTFYICHMKITTLIYKPFVFGKCRYEDLYVGLLNFFMQEVAGIIVVDRDSYAVAVFQKSGQYYMFDPHDRDSRGDISDGPGCACLIRFNIIENLIEKFLKNTGIDQEAEKVPRFNVCAVNLESVERICDCP